MSGFHDLAWLIAVHAMIIPADCNTIQLQRSLFPLLPNDESYMGTNRMMFFYDILEVVSVLDDQIPNLRLIVLFDDKYETDVTHNMKAMTQSIKSGMQRYRYDGHMETIQEILPSAAEGTTLLLVLCSSHNVMTIFQTIRKQRIDSHFVHWLLMTSDTADMSNIIFGLEGVIHEGTKTSFVFRDSLGKISFFSSRVDHEGIVRFFSEEKFTWHSLGHLVFPNEEILYSNMEGRVLKVAANDFEGFFGIDPRSSIPGEKYNVDLIGIDGNIVETLSDALNFSYEVVRPPDGYWGNPLPDGTVSGVIGMTARREVGLALCAIAVTELRESVVDFSYPYSIESLALFSRAPKEKNRALAVLSPFTQETWFCILLTVLAIGPILSLQSKIYRLMMKKTKLTLPQYSFNMFRSLLNQGNRLREDNWSQKCIFGAWYLFGLVLADLYSGMLTAVLAIPAFEKPIDSLSDLPRAIKDGFTLGVLKNSANEMLFREATEGLFKSTWELFNHENPTESFITRPEAGIIKTRDSKFIFVVMQFSYEIMITKKGRRKFHIGRQAFYPHGIGIACPPGVPYKELFSKLIHRMMEAGLLSKWRKDELAKVASLAPADDGWGSRTYAINLTHLQAAFFVVLLGYLMAAIVLAAEVITPILQDFHVS